MSELRRDPLLRRWVIIAPERRADLITRRLLRPPVVQEDPCPFCPGNEHMNPAEIYVARTERTAQNPHGWAVRITPDQKPLLRIEGALERRGVGLFDLMSATGAHELVTDTPDHDAHWADFDLAQMERLLHSYLARYNDLRQDRRFLHAVIMKNYGAPWSRYPHQHSHIVAMPFTPRRIDDEFMGASEYFRLKERCVFCDALREEEMRNVRIVCGQRGFRRFRAVCFRLSVRNLGTAAPSHGRLRRHGRTHCAGARRHLSGDHVEAANHSARPAFQPGAAQRAAAFRQRRRFSLALGANPALGRRAWDGVGHRRVL